MITPSPQGDGGTIFVASASVPGVEGRSGGRMRPWSPEAPGHAAADRAERRGLQPPGADDPARRKAEDGGRSPGAVPRRGQMAYNTVAEIPGGDLKDEIVMLGRPSRFVAFRHRRHRQRRRRGRRDGSGAHSQGAGPQAAPHDPRCALDRRRAGAVGFEGLRSRALWLTILRTARQASQTAPGRPTTSQVTSSDTSTRSRSARTLVRQPDYDKFSAYFNLDNGSGRIRGIFAQENAARGPSSGAGWRRSATWMPRPSPWPTPAAPTTCRSTRSACPGFQFIQDPLEYMTPHAPFER